MLDLLSFRWRGFALLFGAFVSLALLAAALGRPAIAAASARSSAKSLATFPTRPESLPAMRYANLSPSECRAELAERNISFQDENGQAPGVLAPVRLLGPVNGVVYRTALAAAGRQSSPWEVFDCRLVLSLWDFGGILQAHDVDEVVMFSAWRPPSKRWPEGKIADRHHGGLALDAQKFHRKNGEWLVVRDDYHGRIGSETCGDRQRPPQPASAAAKELRSLVCEAVDAHLFNVLLTPNYNRAHFNHIHLEVKAGVKWFVVR
ncbi:MAG TPA: extensin family protein [Polyangiaceae bacterium]